MDEVAQRLRCSPQTLKSWRAVGRGPKSFKLAGRVRYRESDIEEFVARAYAEAEF
jgi:predicted DNA-binding transcriptional regulator AlpA